MLNVPPYFFHLSIDLDSHHHRRDTHPTNVDHLHPDHPLSPWTLTDDWRYDKLYSRTVAMMPLPSTAAATSVPAPLGGTAMKNGLPATKGKFVPCTPPAHFTTTTDTPHTSQNGTDDRTTGNEEETLGWGVVRLYRDKDETDGLYDAPLPVRSAATHSSVDAEPRAAAATPGSKTSSAKKSNRKRQNNIRQEEPALNGRTSEASKDARGDEADGGRRRTSFTDADCTTLCVLAVPSYLTPSDFLGFVGEKTRDEVTHFRMIRTERSNRYMVLMKFRDGRRARDWRREWNGKPFDGMEPEYCHVVFVKSIEVRTTSSEESGQLEQETPSFPDMTNDPFTPSRRRETNSSAVATSPALSATTNAAAAAAASTTLSTKPAPPPTPALVELPTCPVCLERMDESTGLLTILCQHVFHCTCLQKWRGSGCPVCRYTQDDAAKNSALSSLKQPYTDEPVANECRVCHSEDNLWMCLICGHVGCGRYDNRHAYAHFDDTAHSFAMDMLTQRVWDYGSDGYVHRILQNKADGKFLDMELPSRTDSQRPPAAINTDLQQFPQHDSADELCYDGEHDAGEYDGDYVPRSKLTALTHEYTGLLTSQLDSQRLYFEECLSRAAHKTSTANTALDAALSAQAHAESLLSTLQTTHSALLGQTIPNLERERDRAVLKGEKASDLARRMEKEWRSEKAMAEAMRSKLDSARSQIGKLQEDKRGIKDQNRDLMLFLEGRKTLARMGEEDSRAVEGGGAGGLGGELAGATASVAPSEEQSESGGAKKTAKRGKGRK